MVGERIKYHRKRQRYSQDQLGKLAGIEQVIISRIERGTRACRVDELVAIAKVLQMKPSEFLEEAEKQEPEIEEHELRRAKG